jgi:hypothetical protein
MPYRAYAAPPLVRSHRRISEAMATMSALARAGVLAVLPLTMCKARPSSSAMSAVAT